MLTNQKLFETSELIGKLPDKRNIITEISNPGTRMEKKSYTENFEEKSIIKLFIYLG